MKYSGLTPLEQIHAWRVIFSAIGWALLLGFCVAGVVGLAALIDSLKGGLL